MVQAAEKCAWIMRDFLALIRQDSLERSAVSVKPVVRGARILVVDDEPGIAEVLAEVFQLDGHMVEIVGDGEAALEKLGAERYDLILSDVRMPDLDGPALYREVERRHPDLLQRFIFLTGDVMSRKPRIPGKIAVPCLSKPFTLESAVRHVSALPHRDQMIGDRDRIPQPSLRPFARRDSHQHQPAARCARAISCSPSANVDPCSVSLHRLLVHVTSLLPFESAATVAPRVDHYRGEPRHVCHHATSAVCVSQ